nr:immunoglobulin light chain junction region [Macaca mulatta]
CQQYNDFLFSF